MTSYRFSPALLARTLAAVLVMQGLVLGAAAVAVALGAPTGVLTGAVVVTLVVALLVGLLATRLADPVLTVVRLDETGYRVRFLRSAGVRQARWSAVEDVVTATLSGHECAVLRLRDGRSTVVPVRVLDAAPSAFLADLERRLDAEHGYRRLGRR